MQHGVCRIELCCLVYFSAFVKIKVKKKKKIGFMILYVAWFCCYGQLRFLSSVWSNINTRSAGSQEKVKGAGAKVVRSLIKCARQTCRRKLNNAHVITHLRTIHPNIRIINSPIYKPDCVHPSEMGLSIFRLMLSKALIQFHSHLETFDYPIRFHFRIVWFSGV